MALGGLNPLNEPFQCQRKRWIWTVSGFGPSTKHCYRRRQGAVEGQTARQLSCACCLEHTKPGWMLHWHWLCRAGGGVSSHLRSFEISLPVHQNRPCSSERAVNVADQAWKSSFSNNSHHPLSILSQDLGDYLPAAVLCSLKSPAAPGQQEGHTPHLSQQTPWAQGREKCCPAAREEQAWLVFPLYSSCET